MAKITALDTFDVRFPTSRNLDGSDAMNLDPDYSAAYVVVRTDDRSGLAGYGLVFTIGRGNDVQTAAISALSHRVVGRDVDEVLGDLGTFARTLSDDSQLRWLGLVDHLHEHFLDPVCIRNGRYRAPSAFGFSAQMHPKSVADHLFPLGPVWSADGTAGR